MRFIAALSRDNPDVGTSSSDRWSFVTPLSVGGGTLMSKYPHIGVERDDYWVSRASSVILVPASALLTGQVCSAVLASSANLASSRPSTSAVRVIAMPLISKPPPAAGPRVTSALTSEDFTV